VGCQEAVKLLLQGWMVVGLLRCAVCGAVVWCFALQPASDPALFQPAFRDPCPPATSLLHQQHVFPHPSIPACLPLPLTCGSPVAYLPCCPPMHPIHACLSPPPAHPSVPACRGAGAPHNSELARLGARTMLHMMIVDNLIHADLHPGNILGGWVRAVWVGRPGSTGGACWCVGLGTALLSRTNLNPSTRYQLPTITSLTS
jgi:hypothetical protein